MIDNSSMINTIAIVQPASPCTRTLDTHPPATVWFSRMVSIDVGTGMNTTSFIAHHGLITFYSSAFKEALASPLAGAPLSPLTLQKEEPIVFAEFVIWLYTRTTNSGQAGERYIEEHYVSLVKLWMFAHRHSIYLLMNEVINSLRFFIGATRRLPKETLGLVFSSTTTEDSPLRRFIMFAYAKLVDQSWFNTDWDACSPRVPKPTMDMFENPNPWMCPDEFKEINVCSFHVHWEGVRCKEL